MFRFFRKMVNECFDNTKSVADINKACPKCGYQSRFDKYCYQCGCELGEAPRCSCGNFLDRADDYCTACGKHIDKKDIDIPQ